jgi:hypothetical protein
MPAAGMHAASNGRDFGTSRWLLCTTLHQLIIMWKSMESQKLAPFCRSPHYIITAVVEGRADMSPTSSKRRD